MGFTKQITIADFLGELKKETEKLFDSFINPKDKQTLQAYIDGLDQFEKECRNFGPIKKGRLIVKIPLLQGQYNKLKSEFEKFLVQEYIKANLSDNKRFNKTDRELQEEIKKLYENETWLKEKAHQFVKENSKMVNDFKNATPSIAKGFFLLHGVESILIKSGTIPPITSEAQKKFYILYANKLSELSANVLRLHDGLWDWVKALGIEVEDIRSLGDKVYEEVAHAKILEKKNVSMLGESRTIKLKPAKLESALGDKLPDFIEIMTICSQKINEKSEKIILGIPDKELQDAKDRLKPKEEQLEKLNKDLIEIKKEGGKNKTASELAKDAIEINKELLKNQKELDRCINDLNNLEKRKFSSDIDRNKEAIKLRKDAYYLTKMIQINIQKLKVLGEIAQFKCGVKRTFSTKFVSDEQKKVMGTALFNNSLQDPNQLLEHVNRFSEETIDLVVKAANLANAHLKEITQFIENIDQKYQAAESYRAGTLGYYAHHKMGRKSRIEQINLLKNCLKDIENSDMSDEQKVKTAKGLMLFVKHEIDQEFLLFKSRLGTVVGGLLEPVGELGKVSSDYSNLDSMKAFKQYALTNQAKHKLGINSTIITKISLALEDKKWLKKLNPN